MSKYRASPPTYAHILLTTPQKHPWLTSYQLWSHSEQAQAQTSRKTAKITFFTCFSRFAAITIENPALLKPFGNFSKKWKKNLAYTILHCMKTIQKIFWVVLSSIRPIFKLLKNVHVELAREPGRNPVRSQGSWPENAWPIQNTENGITSSILIRLQTFFHHRSS